MIRRRRRTGRWFTTQLRGLLSDDTVLAARFRPDAERPTDEDET